MKFNVLRQGGHNKGGIDETGGTLSGPLLLARHPQLPLEAATKGYVDSSFQSLNASNFTTGTLPISRLPALTGDVTSEAGSNSISLSNSGVTPGEYGKITVNEKGRAVNGTILAASDIPNLNFNKITSDKPTTLAGYGISDAVPNTGALMTGALILSNTPSSSEHLVNKSYVDSMVNNLSAAKTGDIVRKAYPTTPPGFLKCNGGEVDKTTYAALYAVIGESNNSYNIVGAGTPWKNQYEFNTSQSVDIGPWSAATSLPGILGYSKAVVTKNRVYLCGGHNGTTYMSTVYTAIINDDGTLGSWTTGTALPTNNAETSLIVTKNRVYLMGGYNGTAYQNTIYTAIINSDGTLGQWVLDTNTLPITLRSASTFVTKSKVYLIGGNNANGANTTIYVANLNSDGTIGSWSDSGKTFTNGHSHGEVIVIKNKVYALAGSGNTNIYSANIAADGTIDVFNLVGNLPGFCRITQVLATRNRVYVLGGYDGSTAISTVYTAPINADGTLGTWATSNALPGTLYGSQAITTKSKVYLLSGVTGVATWTNVSYVANFTGGLNDYSAYYSDDVNNYMTPGSGQPWRLQYQINNTQIGDITGWSNAGNLPVAIASAIPLVTKNRVYLIGGNRASATYNSAVYMSIINADGTLGTWSTGTAFPVNIADAFAIVTKNRVYVIGGGVNGTASSSVYTAPINSDGTIGTWSATTSLPAIVSYCNAFVTKNRVYVISGSNTNVYTAPINNDGTLGTWASGNSIPVAIAQTQTIVTKNRVYILGGYASTPISTIYCATINSNGILGNWFVSGSLPGGLSHSQAIVTKNMVYLLGGYSGVNNVSTVYTAPILNDGTLGTWTTGTSLPGVLNQSSVIITKNRVYLLGGDTNNNAAYTAVMYTATIGDGMNDYSSYYDGTIVPIEPVDQSTTFKLPDMSATDVNGVYHYIKF